MPKSKSPLHVRVIPGVPDETTAAFGDVVEVVDDRDPEARIQRFPGLAYMAVPPDAPQIGSHYPQLPNGLGGRGFNLIKGPYDPAFQTEDMEQVHAFLAKLLEPYRTGAKVPETYQVRRDPETPGGYIFHVENFKPSPDAYLTRGEPEALRPRTWPIELCDPVAQDSNAGPPPKGVLTHEAPQELELPADFVPDTYRAFVAEALDKKPADVTQEERKLAKEVLFADIYGQAATPQAPEERRTAMLQHFRLLYGAQKGIPVPTPNVETTIQALVEIAKKSLGPIPQPWAQTRTLKAWAAHHHGVREEDLDQDQLKAARKVLSDELRKKGYPHFPTMDQDVERALNKMRDAEAAEAQRSPEVPVLDPLSLEAWAKNEAVLPEVLTTFRAYQQEREATAERIRVLTQLCDGLKDTFRKLRARIVVLTTEREALHEQFEQLLLVSRPLLTDDEPPVVPQADSSKDVPPPPKLALPQLKPGAFSVAFLVKIAVPLVLAPSREDPTPQERLAFPTLVLRGSNLLHTRTMRAPANVLVLPQDFDFGLFKGMNLRLDPKPEAQPPVFEDAVAYGVLSNRWALFLSPALHSTQALLGVHSFNLRAGESTAVFLEPTLLSIPSS